MRTTLPALLLLVSSAFLFGGCVVAPDPYYDHYSPYRGVVLAPALPEVVVLGDRPYYYHRGYHYFYDDGRWYYSRNQRDRWRQLPESHWPRDTRYRHRPPHGHHHDHRW